MGGNAYGKILFQFDQRVVGSDRIHGWTKTSLITPSRVARMLCSIFMASTTHTSCPAETRSPGRTRMEMTRPDNGEAMMLSGVLPEDPRVGGGGTTMPGD